MKKFLLRALIIAQVIILVSCASTPAPAPEWCTNPGAVYSESEYLVQVGNGASEIEARSDAAAALAKSNPIKTGIQAFSYSLRTVILPFIFIFNTDLLLIGISSFYQVIWIFFTSLIAMFAFSSGTQNFTIIKNRWYETLLLIIITFTLFRPHRVADIMGIGGKSIIVSVLSVLIYFGIIIIQKKRQAKVPV